MTKSFYPRIIWTKSFHSYIEYEDGGRTFRCSGGMLFTLLERSVSFKASWRRFIIRVFEEALDNSIDESETNNWHKNRSTQSSPKASAVNTSWFSKKKWINQLRWINKSWYNALIFSGKCYFNISLVWYLPPVWKLPFQTVSKHLQLALRSGYLKFGKAFPQLPFLHHLRHAKKVRRRITIWLQRKHIFI